MSEQVPLEGIEQRVIEAYKTKGLKARPNILVGKSCCAIGALCSGDPKFDTNMRGIENALRILKWHSSDLWNFISGFDNYFLLSLQKVNKGPYLDAGWRTGKAVEEAGLLDNRISMNY